MALDMSVGDHISRASPSACILMFWFNQDTSEQGVGLFPSANDSAQVRLRVDKKNENESKSQFGFHPLSSI